MSVLEIWGCPQKMHQNLWFLQIFFDFVIQKDSFFVSGAFFHHFRKTPWKMNGWNLQPSPIKRKENDLFTKAPGELCSMLITGWLIGILIMVYHNPYITGWYNPLYNPTNQGFFFSFFRAVDPTSTYPTNIPHLIGVGGPMAVTCVGEAQRAVRRHNSSMVWLAGWGPAGPGWQVDDGGSSRKSRKIHQVDVFPFKNLGLEPKNIQKSCQVWFIALKNLLGWWLKTWICTPFRSGWKAYN